MVPGAFWFYLASALDVNNVSKLELRRNPKIKHPNVVFEDTNDSISM